ncbi:glycosyltransferase family protein [Luteolibacter sp. GHJ8]|uniref:Glycosyltransferase family protein n=1 Tax=Luteolibacter rhizosphaerae TaxID=2989719 RepID=A0ABT3FZ93_9BACT|nr:glycosyltransferase family protein [Luteolibacter rhizosphaerae]MCW1912907.1 glycosyltransferase family protein [Luteolibacter rhizosphaerae]
MRDYDNVMRAYNEAGTAPGITVYVHHDVFLPESFEAGLLNSLESLGRIDPDWAVAGVAGMQVNGGRPTFVAHVRDRGRDLGSPISSPHEVQTLDELILVVNGPAVFDESIPGNHFYGCDICMQGMLAGRRSYVVEAYCHHNSGLNLENILPADFWPAREYIASNYRDCLPIHTTCTSIPATG